MNRSKREEHIIFTTFSFQLFVFVIGIVILGFFSIPQFRDVEENKNQLEQTYGEYVSLTKNGLSYEDFSTLMKGSTQSPNLGGVIGKDFFDNYLINQQGGKYLDFLSDLKSDLNAPENAEKIKNQSQKVQKILPTYLEYNRGDTDSFLNDFLFVQYIESIIRAFQLKYSDAIGIQEIQVVEEYMLDKEEKTDVDINIFRIPLQLKLQGSKKQILDFLYYVEKSGNVVLEMGNNDSVELNILQDTENVFTQSKLRTLLKSKNVFENQIIDIEEIRIPQYPDSNYKLRTSDFVEFIKETQGNDSFEVDVTLLFYVKGIPDFTIEEYMNQFVYSYNLSQKLVQKTIKDSKETSLTKTKFKKINESLKQLGKNISKLKKGFSKKEDLESVYRETIVSIESLDELNKQIGYEKLYTVFEEKYQKDKQKLNGANQSDYYKKISNDMEQFMSEIKQSGEKVSYNDYKKILYYNAILESIK